MRHFPEASRKQHPVFGIMIAMLGGVQVWPAVGFTNMQRGMHRFGIALQWMSKIDEAPRTNGSGITRDICLDRGDARAMSCVAA